MICWPYGDLFVARPPPPLPPPPAGPVMIAQETYLQQLAWTGQRIPIGIYWAPQQRTGRSKMVQDDNTISVGFAHTNSIPHGAGTKLVDIHCGLLTILAQLIHNIVKHLAYIRKTLPGE